MSCMKCYQGIPTFLVHKGQKSKKTKKIPEGQPQEWHPQLSSLLALARSMLKSSFVFQISFDPDLWKDKTVIQCQSKGTCDDSLWSVP